MGLQDDDPVSDSEAFWITRPISGSRLLAAKASALILLWIIPALVSLPLWLSHGYSLGQLGVAAFRTMEVQVIITLLAVPFAVISPNGSRFVVYILMAGVVVLVLGLGYRMLGLGRFTAISNGIEESRARVFASIWVCASIAMTLIQYRSRRTRSSMIVLVAAATMAFSVTIFWPWDMTSAPIAGNGTQVPRPILQFKSAILVPNYHAKPLHSTTAMIEFSVSGLHDGDFATTTSATQILQWPNGKADIYTSSPDTNGAVAACWIAALGERARPIIRTDLQLSAEETKCQLQKTPSYSAKIEGEVRRPKIAANLWARDGETTRSAASTLKIIEVISNGISPADVVISISESAPRLSQGPSSAFFEPLPELRPSPCYFLINREDRRSLIAEPTAAGEPFVSATIEYFRTTLVFDASRAWKGNIPRDIHTWIKNAELVKVTADRVTTFVSAVELASFEPQMGDSAGRSP